jgi:transcriptional regulator with PAS, ATPase and Fis domain
MRYEGSLQLIGTSGAICELRQEIDRVARSDAKVLITGESGTGKEVVARAIALHPESSRNGQFIPVNCAGIAETLLESELFGHVKGSFTGAYRDKPGKLEMASNGTLFLDEIGETTLRMQGLLLRFLETGEIQKVGAERVATAANVRIVAATNRDLWHLIARGHFREDLFYRLNVIHLTIPPLRERREDVPQLIDHFLTRFTRAQEKAASGRRAYEHGAGSYGTGHVDGYVADNGNGHSAPGLNGYGSNGHSHSQGRETSSPVRAIASDAMAALCRYSWPGNVRQVENVIERLVVTGRQEMVPLEALPPEIRKQDMVVTRPLKERRRTIADDLFKKLVDDRESFWTAVYPLYMNREIAKGQLRDVVHKGLEEARGNYRIVLRLFNMESGDYKRFLNFLRKHDCQLPFKEYR